ncbi:MAG: CvpA family protein [Mariprofundaceae bacterium]|nr:CvpA family protein [Mariprofundaceae bacterium]
MNFFDYLMIGLVGLSMVLSLWRGFVREIISLIGLVLAFFAASRVAGDTSDILDGYISNQTVSDVAGFILVFVLVMMLVGIIGMMVRKLVDMADLTATDRTLGIFFGAARGMLLIGLSFLIYTSYAKPDHPWMNKSLLTPYVIQLSDLIGKTIPEDYPFSTRKDDTLPSPQISQKALETISNHIPIEDKEAMKSLLLDTLEAAKP